MFCHQCGNKISDEAKFCAKCGKSVEVSPNISKTEISTKNTEVSENAIDSTGNLIFIFIILCAIGGAVYWYFNRNINPISTPTTSSENTTSTTSSVTASSQPTSRVFYVQADNTRVHDCASLSCKVLGYYSANESVTLSYGSLADLPEWVQFTFPDSNGNTLTGYLKSTTLGENQVDTKQIEIDALKNKVETLQNNKPETIPKTVDLSSIIKEWRKNTAYIVCFWNYSNGTQYKAQSGSALSAMVGSDQTIITNKHVTFDSVSGYYANECDIRFPDDDGFYFYSKNTPNSNGQGYQTNVGNLTVASNGNDVAFITGVSSSWTSLSSNYLQPAAIPFASHIRSNNYSCKNDLITGDHIVLLGYPSYGTQMGSVLNSPAEPTATEGIVSGRDGVFYTTSAKIEHGNSGGLAIDEKNNCYFGIPTWNESGSFESLGRILPSSSFLHY